MQITVSPGARRDGADGARRRCGRHAETARTARGDGADGARAQAQSRPADRCARRARSLPIEPGQREGRALIRRRRRAASSMPPSTKTSSCSQRASGSLPACPQEVESSCRSAAHAGRADGALNAALHKGGRCWKSKSFVLYVSSHFVIK